MKPGIQYTQCQCHKFIASQIPVLSATTNNLQQWLKKNNSTIFISYMKTNRKHKVCIPVDVFICWYTFLIFGMNDKHVNADTVIVRDNNLCCVLCAHIKNLMRQYKNYKPITGFQVFLLSKFWFHYLAEKCTCTYNDTTDIFCYLPLIISSSFSQSIATSIYCLFTENIIIYASIAMLFIIFSLTNQFSHTYIPIWLKCGIYNLVKLFL